MRAARPTWTGGSVLSGLTRVLLALALLLGPTACGGEEITPPTPGTVDVDQRADDARTTLRALQKGLAEGDASAVRALAADDGASRALVAGIAANAAAIRLSDVTFRYVDGDDTALPDRLKRYGGAAFGVTVTVAWRIPGYDPGETRVDTRFAFVETADGARLAAVGGASGRTPLWLAEPLDVVRDRDSLVLVSKAAARPAQTYAAQARRAVRDVRLVLPDWRGRLVVEVPSSQALLEEVLGADQDQYAAIAGVTTTTDGLLVRDTPVHVYLNPAVYDGLGERGAQVVLSHEATHVATRAPLTSGVPTWLLEGFADYVALAHAGVPLDTAARQIIARVRKEGPPADLPTDDDLSASAPGLGATYEEAWTVCRYLANTYGEAALIRFYDAVVGGADVSAAFARLGTTQDRFVDGWRDDLRSIARR